MKARVRQRDYEEVTYSDLTVGNMYTILGIEGDDYRIISDQGLPYLYPAGIFELIDPSEPDDWVTEYGTEGERYSYPQELARRGFFEDYFDRKPDPLEAFRRYTARLFRRQSPGPTLVAKPLHAWRARTRRRPRSTLAVASPRSGAGGAAALEAAASASPLIALRG